jgi:hypothetical protein
MLLEFIFRVLVKRHRNFGSLYHGPMRRDNCGARRRALAAVSEKAHACVELSSVQRANL